VRNNVCSGQGLSLQWSSVCSAHSDIIGGRRASLKRHCLQHDHINNQDTPLRKPRDTKQKASACLHTTNPAGHLWAMSTSISVDHMNTPHNRSVCTAPAAEASLLDIQCTDDKRKDDRQVHVSKLVAGAEFCTGASSLLMWLACALPHNSVCASVLVRLRHLPDG